MHPLAVVKLFKRTLVSALLLLIIVACGPPEPSLSQPWSPPPRVLQSHLLDQPWRLTDVITQSGAAALEAFKPIYLIFNRNGTVNVSSGRCLSGRYAILYRDGNRYLLTQSMYSLVRCGTEALQDNAIQDCGGLTDRNSTLEECAQAIEEQLDRVSQAIGATDEFILSNDTLTLRGRGVELRLVQEGP